MADEERFSPQEQRAFRFGAVALCLFTAFFFLMAFSNRHSHVDDSHYHITASFGRTDGLLVGDKVRLAGITIGRVSDARLDDGFNAVLTLEIKEGIRIPDDSSASIISAGLMGSKYIEIEPGGSEDYLENGGQFSYTQDAMVLTELLDRIVAIGKGKRQTQDAEEKIDE
jgi:phospholipid/cholesterol/gamma-HCH transport system substrate-binding protein